MRAFDLNGVANDVYEHNFGMRPWQAWKNTKSAFCHTLTPTATPSHPQQSYHVLMASTGHCVHVP